MLTDKETKSLRRFREELEWYRAVFEEMDKADPEETRLYRYLLDAQAETYEKTIACVEERQPLLASYWSICPEVYRAMDIHHFGIQAHHYQRSQAEFLMQDLDECDRLGLTRDNCSLLRLTLYYIIAGLMPTPTMIIHKLEPCDALLGFHEAVRVHDGWRDVPYYSLDPPYWKEDDDRTLDYYAGEIAGVVSFLEENTGKKLDLDRLREAVEESNMQYELWGEYVELRRSVPCPHNFDLGSQLYPAVQIYGAGDPRCTAWLREMIADAEDKVRAKKGGVEPEKLRVLWFDIFGQWLPDLAAWLEKEWNANIVIDMSNICPYTPVDTTNEHTMFRDLGKRTLCDAVMVRQVRGTADRLLSDLAMIISDYKIDAVIPPTHVGHKDQIASLGLMRDVCRESGATYLDMGTVDVFDPRYTSMDVIQDRLSQYLAVLGP